MLSDSSRETEAKSLIKKLCAVFQMGFPGGARGKEPACQYWIRERHRFNPWVGKMPWRRAWQPTPVFLPGESCGQKSLVGYSLWGHKESERTEITLQECSEHPNAANIRCWIAWRMAHIVWAMRRFSAVCALFCCWLIIIFFYNHTHFSPPFPAPCIVLWPQ